MNTLNTVQCGGQADTEFMSCENKLEKYWLPSNCEGTVGPNIMNKESWQTFTVHIILACQPGIAQAAEKRKILN